MTQRLRRIVFGCVWAIPLVHLVNGAWLTGCSEPPAPPPPAVEVLGTVPGRVQRVYGFGDRLRIVSLHDASKTTHLHELSPEGLRPITELTACSGSTPIVAQAGRLLMCAASDARAATLFLFDAPPEGGVRRTASVRWNALPTWSAITFHVQGEAVWWIEYRGGADDPVAALRRTPLEEGAEVTELDPLTGSLLRETRGHLAIVDRRSEHVILVETVPLPRGGSRWSFLTPTDAGDDVRVLAHLDVPHGAAFQQLRVLGERRTAVFVWQRPDGVSEVMTFDLAGDGAEPRPVLTTEALDTGSLQLHPSGRLTWIEPAAFGDDVLRWSRWNDEESPAPVHRRRVPAGIRDRVESQTHLYWVDRYSPHPGIARAGFEDEVVQWFTSTAKLPVPVPDAFSAASLWHADADRVLYSVPAEGEGEGQGQQRTASHLAWLHFDR